MTKESGGHRIQRIPPTEKRGRVHTSTVTVAVFDIGSSEPTCQFDEEDIEVQWFSGSGAGGQHRNKHQNSCRIKHIPTGMVAAAQTRSRESSYRLALTDLKKRVDSQSSMSYYNDVATDRALQRGSGMRGDKIRTYRFQDDKVTDHRSQKTTSCKNVLSGKIELLW